MPGWSKVACGGRELEHLRHGEDAAEREPGGAVRAWGVGGAESGGQFGAESGPGGVVQVGAYRAEGGAGDPLQDGVRALQALQVGGFPGVDLAALQDVRVARWVQYRDVVAEDVGE